MPAEAGFPSRLRGVVPSELFVGASEHFIEAENTSWFGTVSLHKVPPGSFLLGFRQHRGSYPQQRILGDLGLPASCSCCSPRPQFSTSVRRGIPVPGVRG